MLNCRHGWVQRRLIWAGAAGAVVLLAVTAIEIPRIRAHYARLEQRGQSGLTEFSPPFDPRPLMDELAKRVTTDTFRFVVFGDSKHAAVFPAMVELVEKKLNPDFVITTGDMVQTGKGDIYHGDWLKLSQEAGAAMHTRPWWPVTGNHELEGLDRPANTENFRRYYNLEKDNYSFSFRNVRVLVLPYPTLDAAEEPWLEHELQQGAAAKQHMFVLQHRPFYTIGVKTEAPNHPTSTTKLFTRYGVRAVICGDDHMYYRTKRDQVYYFISAGAGARWYYGKQLDQAQSDDVYVTGVPESFEKGPKKFVYHQPGVPDRFFDAQVPYVILFSVDGARVRASCITEKGETLDTVMLAGEVARETR